MGGLVDSVWYIVRALRRIMSLLYGILHTCSLNISLLTWITGLFVCSHRYGPSGVRSVQVEYNSRSSRHLDVTIERLLLVCRVLYQITYYSHLDPLHQHLIRPATG
jgi:hypothetical protein